MAEKGVVEERISQRLSRKRESFENKKIQDESRRIKRRRRDCPRGDEDAGSEAGEECVSGDKCEAGARCEAGRCDRSFFDVDCETLAQRLLGCVLVRQRASSSSEQSKTTLKGKIVETEAYLGGDDKAAHSFNGKMTERNTAMFMQPGTSYVYSIYGMYCCFNISSRGDGAAVLVRALEPIEGTEGMRERRKAAKKDKDLCSGPAKLCQAMEIDKSCNKLDLVSSDCLWVEPSDVSLKDADIVKSSRIGVDYAKEWAMKPLRYYIRGNVCVSKK